MRRAWLPVFALALAWTLPVLAAFGQNQAVTVRGKIVRMEAPDQFIVRTADNKEVILYTNPETRYTIEGKAGRFADLRVGTEINTAYSVRDNRNWVSTVTVGPVAVSPDTRPAVGQVTEATVIRGKIVRMQAPDQIIVRTSAGKEVILFTSPQTRYMINGKAVQFADLRVGAEVNADFTIRDGRHHVTVVTVGGGAEAVPAPATTTEATTVQGTIVRVVGEDQVIVKTSDNKEVTIYVQPQTKYVFDDRAVRFSDLRAGSDVRVEYDLRDRRPIARGIFGLRRNK